MLSVLNATSDWLQSCHPCPLTVMLVSNWLETALPSVLEQKEVSSLNLLHHPALSPKSLLYVILFLFSSASVSLCHGLKNIFPIIPSLTPTSTAQIKGPQDTSGSTSQICKQYSGLSGFCKVVDASSISESKSFHIG